MFIKFCLILTCGQEFEVVTFGKPPSPLSPEPLYKVIAASTLGTLWERLDMERLGEGQDMVR